MQINKFDILNHKIIVGKSRNGDVSSMEIELMSALKNGIKKKCPYALDFHKRMNERKPLILKQSFIDKHRDLIIKITETPYKLMKWFISLSAIVAILVEIFYA